MRATKDIPKDTKIGYYAGYLIPERSAPRNVYIMATDDDNDRMYDAYGCGNEMRFINGYNDIADDANVCIGPVEQIGDSDWITARSIQTLRKIRANEELLLDYGDDYWELEEKRTQKKLKKGQCH